MPFPGGKAVRIIQGYNGGTHQGRSRYGLDLVLADGDTSGAEVVSPIDGTVAFSQGGGNGCVAIAFRDGSYSVMLCHVILNGALSRGASIARGQTLGTVGAAGTVGNNGVPHVHMELHQGSRANNGVPFGDPGGLPLEGKTLSASEAYSEHGRREPIVSTNRGGSGPVTAQRSERTQPMTATTSAPAPVAAASVPSSVRSIPAAASGSAATASTRRAVVNGTESCLKVRKQPSAEAPVVGCLKEGSEVALKPVTSGDAGWRQTDQGWVSSEYLKRTRAVVVGTDGCLNVRESWSASAAKLGCLPDGTAVTIAEGPKTGEGFSWYRIEPTGSLKQSGWVVGKHLD